MEGRGSEGEGAEAAEGDVLDVERCTVERVERRSGAVGGRDMANVSTPKLERMKGSSYALLLQR